jgi:chromosome segregation ATPase
VLACVRSARARLFVQTAGNQEVFLMRRIISSAVGLCVLAMAVSASAQTLADLAKKDTARRKTVKHPSKVYTNEDVEHVKPIVPMTAEAEAANAAAAASQGQNPAPQNEPLHDGQEGRVSSGQSGAAPAAAAATPDAQAKPGTQVKAGEEGAWRARMQSARDAVSRTQLQLESMRTRAAQLTAASAAAPEDQRAGTQKKQQEALQEYDKLRADLQKNQKALSDLEGEAAKAGVPPGWVR